MPPAKNPVSARRIRLSDVLEGRFLTSVWVRYGLAAFVVAIAAVARMTLLPSLGMRVPFLTLYPAVVVAAMLGGFGPGVLATALSGALVVQLWVQSGNVFYGDLLDWVGLAIFVGCSVAISAIAAVSHGARRRLAEHTRDLAETNQRLSEEVTRREEIDARLRESEDRFRLAASNDGVTLYEQDHELRYTWLYPLRPEHAGALGRTDAERLPPGEGDELMERKRRVMETGVPQRLEFRARLENTVRYYDTFISPRRSADGRIVGVAGTALEITERRRREQARQLLAAIVESSEDAILAIDLAGVVTSWNRGATRLFGYRAEEALGRSVTFLIPPERHDEEPRILERIRRGERTEHYETIRQRRDGTLLEVSLSVSPLRDERGEIVGASKIARDVTERNLAARSQRFLADLNARLSPLESPEEIIREASRLVGEQLQAQRCCFGEWCEDRGGADVHHEWCAGATDGTTELPGLFNEHAAEWRRLLPDGLAVEDVARDTSAARLGLRCESLGVRSFATTGFVRRAPCLVSLTVFCEHPRRWRDTDLQLLKSVVERVWPLVERARSESALRASERQLRLITDNAPVSLAQLNTERRFKFVNLAYARRFGREPSDIVGAHVSEVIGVPAYELVHHQLDAAFAGRHVEFEKEVPLPGQGSRWVHVIYTPERLPDGGVGGVIALISDITARKEAEREVALARDQALAASRAKDDFLAALSHELRTPLNPVLLIASEAAENPLLSSEVRRDFATIRKNVELEARLIDDLLDLTRITHGKLPLEIGPVNAEAALQDALSVIRPDVEQKRISLSVDLAASRSTVSGDPVRLQQVFWNVLKNAVKFTPAGGRIAVTSGNSGDGSRFEVVVSDNGIGMTPAEIERVFDAFTQGDHAAGVSSHRFGGMGLGLTISRMLVELHHGSIHAESDGRGRGATFTVALPLAEQALTDGLAPVGRPTTRRETVDVRAWRPQRVLVIEDHAPTREALASLLRRRSYEVLTAGSVEEARSQIESGGVGLVISDIGLPDGDGCDLMAELHQRNGLRGIALTGYGMEADVARSIKAGFVAHLTKPVHVQALEAALAVASASQVGPLA